MQNLIEIFKNYPLSILKHVQSDESLMNDLITSICFLDEDYKISTLNQRIFHVVHNKPEILKCICCGGAAKWNKFDAVNYNEL